MDFQQYLGAIKRRKTASNYYPASQTNPTMKCINVLFKINLFG